MQQGLKENWTGITEDIRSSNGQIEAVTDNLGSNDQIM